MEYNMYISTHVSLFRVCIVFVFCYMLLSKEEIKKEEARCEIGVQFSARPLVHPFIIYCNPNFSVKMKPFYPCHGCQI